MSGSRTKRHGYINFATQGDAVDFGDLVSTHYVHVEDLTVMEVYNGNT